NRDGPPLSHFLGLARHRAHHGESRGRPLYLRRGRDRPDGRKSNGPEREEILRRASSRGGSEPYARSVVLMATRATGGGKTRSATKARREAVYPAALNREQIVDLYYWMRLTRTLEERLVALYR